MSIIGSSERWYVALVDMYDIIYEAIVRVWPECKRKMTRASSMGAASRRVMARQAHEDPITRCLIMHLRRASAYRAIRHQIEQHAQQLLYAPALFRDVKRPEHFSTTHQRPDVPIELRHLLLAAHGVP